MKTTAAKRYRFVRPPRGIAAMAAALLLLAACGGGGGGSGDDGDDPAAGVLASDCRSSVLTTVGTTFRFDYAYSGAAAGGVSNVGTVTRLATFEGQTDATEVDSDMSEDFQLTGQAAVRQITNTLGYVRQTADADVLYGSVVTFASGADQGTVVRTVFTPPLLDRRFTLAAGQRTTTTTTGTATATLPSGRQEINQLSQTVTVTFTGKEQITVPAGTFDSCRFEINLTGTAQPSVIWYQVGTGVALKSTTAIGANSSTLTSELLATSRLNGNPL
jgi:hypothetical protein